MTLQRLTEPLFVINLHIHADSTDLLEGIVDLYLHVNSQCPAPTAQDWVTLRTYKRQNEPANRIQDVTNLQRTRNLYHNTVLEFKRLYVFKTDI